jgi:hypothetical protein
MAITEFCVLDYLNSRLIRLGVELSEIEVSALQIAQMPGIGLEDKLTAENIAIADKACLFPLKDILIMPDISEGGYSSKLDRPSIEKWYNSEVQRLGLGGDPNFSLTPKIRDASNRW